MVWVPIPWSSATRVTALLVVAFFVVPIWAVWIALRAEAIAPPAEVL